MMKIGILCLGFRTAFLYAKQKLGHLLSDGVDEHALARDDGIDMARAFAATVAGASPSCT